jgi:hypothetical protein
MFSLDVSCWIVTMEILQLPWSRRCLLVNTPRLNFQVNCNVSYLQDNSSARITQKTQPLYCCRRVFTVPFHKNCRGADDIENIDLSVVPRNGRCLQSHWVATGLYATLWIMLRPLKEGLTHNVLVTYKVWIMQLFSLMKILLLIYWYYVKYELRYFLSRACLSLMYCYQ